MSSLVIYKKKKTTWEGSVARMGSLCDSLECSPVAVVFLLPEPTSLEWDWTLERNTQQLHVKS